MSVRLLLVLAAVSCEPMVPLWECTCNQTMDYGTGLTVTTQYYTGVCSFNPIPEAVLLCEADLPGSVCECGCDHVGFCP